MQEVQKPVTGINDEFFEAADILRAASQWQPLISAKALLILSDQTVA